MGGMLDSPWEDEVFPAVVVASSSSSLGQVMSTILSARPRRLKAAIAELGPSPAKSASGALLDESLCFLWRNMEDVAKREEPLDHILVPLIERFKDPKYRKQVFILIKWLFRNELLLRAILISLKEIISTKSNHFTAFAWCSFVTTLLQLSPSRLFQGEKEHHHPTVLRILCGSIPQLLIIAREGSTMVEGFELPTRLSVAAADCIILLTESLAKGESLSSKTSGDSEKLLTKSKKRKDLIKILSNSDDKLSNQTQATGMSDDIGAEFLLWSYLNELIILVEKLEAWSKKSLPLREKGLKQVREWLMEIKEYHSFARDEAEGGKSLMNGVLLLSSCWKHYGMLLRFETRKCSQNLCQVFDQYLSALEFYTQHDAESDPVKLKSSLDTRKFFLNCIALLWGRLSVEERKMVTSETGINLITGLLTQLKCGREDLVEISVTIMKTVIFSDTSQFQDILPLLLSLLEERDSASKAVIQLMAEFCNTDGHGITEMIKLLASGSHNQRKNAIDVIVELVRGHPDARNKVSPASWQDIARHLLECLGDEELVDHALESNLFPYLDPCFLVPRFIHLCFSGNEKVGTSSTSALTSVLSQHNDNFSVIEKLLDSLSDISHDHNSSLEKGMSEKYVEEKSPLSSSGSKLGIDHVLKLTPVWMESVKHFDRLIDQLINKIFSDPSNPVLFRFMSYAGERLTEAGDLILHRVLVYMQSQELDESWVSNRSEESFEREDEISKITVFSRLCPLLILRLLPLKIFDNLESSKLYGIFSDDKILIAQADATDLINRDCITDELIARALGLCEYEDVRKVAAELCGRLHPRFLIPTLAYHMKSASERRNALKMKACLFALCTSLVSRGVESASQPLMSQIRLTIDSILSRPSFDPIEVPKVQHGCIDCMALMICAEVQSTHPGFVAVDHSVLTSVVQRLVSEPASSAMNRVRLCMASALVSAIQKVGSSGQSVLARRTLSSLISSFQSIADLEIRIACLQVLYSAVYHLKSSVLPYSTDLLNLSLKSLKKGSDKEKIMAAKLLASLMASEDEILERISPGLVKAKSILMRISMAGSSSGELTEMCDKLLSCLTFPL